MPFKFRNIFSKKSRTQRSSSSSSTFGSPVIRPYPQGSSPTSSCSTLVDAPSIERKDLTVVKCISIENAHDVWLASHNHTEQLYALHIYQLHLMSDEQHDLMHNEQAMMSLLPGSGQFVNIISHWSDMGETSILTDYYPSTLQDDLCDQPFNKSQAQLYAAHIISALLLLHNMQAAHNDVKLSNLHLTPTGRPVLGGLGKTSTTSSMDGALHDIRALGTCMYQMATGTVPFDEQGSFVPFPMEDSIDPDLQLLIVELLTNQITDLECLKDHSYFDGIDWVEVASPRNAEPTIQESDDSSVNTFYADDCDSLLADMEKQETFISVFAETSSVDSLSSIMSSPSYPGSPIATPQWEDDQVVWRYTPGYRNSPEFVYSRGPHDVIVFGSAFEA